MKKWLKTSLTSYTNFSTLMMLGAKSVTQRSFDKHKSPRLCSAALHAGCCAFKWQQEQRSIKVSLRVEMSSHGLWIWALLHVCMSAHGRRRRTRSRYPERQQPNLVKWAHHPVRPLQPNSNNLSHFVKTCTKPALIFLSHVITLQDWLHVAGAPVFSALLFSYSRWAFGFKEGQDSYLKQTIKV